MNTEDFIKAAKKNIKAEHNVLIKNLAVVWESYILGNNKAMIAVIGGEEKTEAYFEVTFNTAKQEMYIDEYLHVSNHAYEKL